jgi:CarboxypepD_reg-like domain
MIRVVGYGLFFVLFGSSITAIAQTTASAPAPATSAHVEQPSAAPSEKQQSAVYGRVLDDAGRPLPGAIITLIGTNTIMVTDGTGTFSLPVSVVDADSNVQLSCTYQGCTDRRLTITPSTEEALFLMTSPAVITRDSDF